MTRTIAMMDKQGRVYLPRELSKGLGRRFFIFKVRNEIVMVPIPKDPIKSLQELGKKLPNKSIKQLKAEILEEATKEAFGSK